MIDSSWGTIVPVSIQEHLSLPHQVAGAFLLIIRNVNTKEETVNPARVSSSVGELRVLGIPKMCHLMRENIEDTLAILRHWGCNKDSFCYL